MNPLRWARVCRRRGLPALSATRVDLVEHFEGTQSTGTLIAWCRKEGR